MDAADDPREPLVGSRAGAALSQRHLSLPPSRDHLSEHQEDRTEGDEAKKMENLSSKSQWIVLALASGACAAFNGVFAKLYAFFFCLSAAPTVPNLGKEKDILLLI